MARKAAATPTVATPTRGRGRPKKTEADLVAQDVPKKRGRPAAIEQEEEEAETETAPPKKRGRPSKTEIAPPEDVKPKGRGRPRKQDAVETPLTPERTSPRARKATAAPAAPASPVTKRAGRGRPPKNATAKAAKSAPRLDPKIRSKLRDRNQIQKERDAKAAAKAKADTKPARRGRPGRPRKDGAAPGTKMTARKVARDAVTKPPRARKGFAFWEVEKKYLPQLQQIYLDLQANDEAEAPVKDEDENEGEDEDIAPVDGAEENDITLESEDQIIEEQDTSEMGVDAQDGAQEELAVEKAGESDSADDEEEEEEVTETVQVEIQEQTLGADDALQAVAHQQIEEVLSDADENGSLFGGMAESMYQPPQVPIAFMGS